MGERKSHPRSKKDKKWKSNLKPVANVERP